MGMLRTALASAAVICCASGNAAAEDWLDGWTFSFTTENDMFPFGGPDRNYTTGHLISLTSPADREGGFLDKISQHITRIRDGERQARVQISFSHTTFTPEDLTLPTPDPADRPYAGMALWSASLMASSTDFDDFSNVTYSLGIVGPASAADDIQIGWHELIKGVEPRGWPSQIQERLVGGVSYQRTRRIDRWGGDQRSDDGLITDLYSHWGLSLGTVQTAASVGLSLRVGQDPPEDYGLPRLAPALRGGSFFEGAAAWGWYAFAGVEQHYVAYDVTLDEAPASGVISVARRDWVRDLQVGAAWYSGRYRIGYTHVWRGETFRGQREADNFGAISISAVID